MAGSRIPKGPLPTNIPRQGPRTVSGKPLPGKPVGTGSK